MEGNSRRLKLAYKSKKTEYLRCYLSGIDSISEPQVTKGGEVVACTTIFRYLGLVIQSNGEIDGDFTNHIRWGAM